MTKIAHASGDERRKLRGGKAGDQTGKEVCIRQWYNRPWNVVLHWKDPKKAERCAVAMERAAKNDNFGYDQSQRNSALVEARKHGYDPGEVDKKVETDCSALVALACMYAGIPESVLYRNGNSATTATLRKWLAPTGEFEIRTAPKYTKSPDNNSRGDIPLYEGHHVAVQIEDGKNVRKTTPALTGKAYPGVFPVFSDLRDDYRKGDGSATLTNYPTQIMRVQMLVNWINTGDPHYDKALSGSIVVDGKYGRHTEDAVKAAQKKLGVKVDGVFGLSTLKAAKAYRR